MYSAIAMPPGEVLDRLSILDLKINNASGAKAEILHMDRIQYEAAERRLYMTLSLRDRQTYTSLFTQLKAVNSTLWGVEDRIRICERDQNFGEEFIGLARSVYTLNDKRNEFKRAVSELFHMSDDMKIYARDK